MFLSDITSVIAEELASTLLDERVKLFVCGAWFLEVLVEAVWVGHSHLVDGLFPPRYFPAFDKTAGSGCDLSTFLGAFSCAFVFDIADHQPQCL